MGCPTSYDGMSATWSKGKLSRLSSSTKSHTYTYNGFGQRVAKAYSYLAGSAQAGDVTAYNKKYYYDHAGRLVAEETSKTVQGTGTVTERIVFLYDESSVIGMEHTTGGVSTRYYFQRNLLGDVQAIVNTNGTVVARYLYDAFGNCTIASGTTNTAVANANPIRYRGYYYDDDTGLYYCNARYYSPKWRRFISPDDTAYLDPESVNGLNLYCYCNNDPVNCTDPSGHMPEWAKWLIGGLVIAGLAIATIATGGAAGGVAGFIWAGALKGAIIGAVSGAVVSGTIGGISSAIAGNGFWSGFATGAADGFMSGAIVGGITGAISSTIQVANAAQMWQPGTSPRTSTPFRTMKHHYQRHVIEEGFSKGNNIVKYTKDAVAFMNRNAGALKFRGPRNAGLQAYWTFVGKGGMNGQFTSAGKILTFWYIELQ